MENNSTVKTMPAVALRGTTILPGMIVHFDISRKVSDWLDREDFIPENYILEISSPGLGGEKTLRPGLHAD